MYKYIYEIVHTSFSPPVIQTERSKSSFCMEYYFICKGYYSFGAAEVNVFSCFYFYFPILHICMDTYVWVLFHSFNLILFEFFLPLFPLCFILNVLMGALMYASSLLITVYCRRFQFTASLFFMHRPFYAHL